MLNINLLAIISIVIFIQVSIPNFKKNYINSTKI